MRAAAAGGRPSPALSEDAIATKVEAAARSDIAYARRSCIRRAWRRRAGRIEPVRHERARRGGRRNRAAAVAGLIPRQGRADGQVVSPISQRRDLRKDPAPGGRQGDRRNEDPDAPISRWRAMASSAICRGAARVTESTCSADRPRTENRAGLPGDLFLKRLAVSREPLAENEGGALRETHHPRLFSPLRLRRGARDDVDDSDRMERLRWRRNAFRYSTAIASFWA